MRIAILSLLTLTTITGCSQQITLTGGAWLKDEILRGMDISVCTPTAIASVQAVIDKHKSLWEKKETGGGLFDLFFKVARGDANDDLQKTVKSLHDSSQCIVRSSTDIEGKYSFIISRQEIDNHSQLFAFAVQQNFFWVVNLTKVNLKNRIDLNNQNLTPVLNPYAF